MAYMGIGGIAAVITALSWAGSCQIHTTAGRILGATNVTVARVPLYIISLGMVAFLTGADTGLPSGAFVFLLLSALLGITISDTAFYVTCVGIGPRLGLLLQSLSSSVAALLGFLVLGENIGLMGICGILTATFGVAFVLMEGGLKTGTNLEGVPRSQLLRGIFFGLITAFSLGLSFLLYRQALLLGVSPVWGAFLRISMGGMLIWLVAGMRGLLVPVMKQAWTDGRVIKLLLAGMAVSAVGNSLSGVAMLNAETGVATTLIGLQPIFIIPIVALIERKMPSFRAIVGTGIAFAGSAMLFLR